MVWMGHNLLNHSLSEGKLCFLSVFGYYKYICSECSYAGFGVKLNFHFFGIKCARVLFVDSMVIVQMISYKYNLFGSPPFLNPFNDILFLLTAKEGTPGPTNP